MASSGSSSPPAIMRSTMGMTIVRAADGVDPHSALGVLGGHARGLADHVVLGVVVARAEGVLQRHLTPVGRDLDDPAVHGRHSLEADDDGEEPAATSTSTRRATNVSLVVRTRSRASPVSRSMAPVMPQFASARGEGRGRDTGQAQRYLGGARAGRAVCTGLAPSSVGEYSRLSPGPAPSLRQTDRLAREALARRFCAGAHRIR